MPYGAAGVVLAAVLVSGTAAAASSVAQTAPDSTIGDARRAADAGDVERARRLVAGLLDRSPANVDALLLLAGIEEKQQRLDQAVETYTRAIAAAPSSAEAYDRRGFVLGRLNRVPEAIADFETAAKLAPRLFDAHYHLGATLWWTGQRERAVEPLRLAVSLNPRHAEARYTWG